MQKYLVCAFTGVAASNVGNARTLHDLFKLQKLNPVSGDLMPLDGEDLKEFSEVLDGTDLLVLDEISMVSRPMLSMIDQRLKEWRAFKKHRWQRKAFGGLGVILAGDFGQLPPTHAESLSLGASGRAK